MKKLLIVCGLALVGMQNAAAQNEDSWIPKHVGIGVGVGTTGIVVDASTTINRWFGVRAGVDIVPEVKIGTDLDLGTEGYNADFARLTEKAKEINSVAGQTLIDLSGLPNGLPNSMDVEGKLTNTTFHFLVDIYPFKNSGFHATVGFYAGGKELISVYNKDAGFLKPITQWNNVMTGATQLPQSVTDLLQREGLGKSDMIGAELGDYFIAPNPADNGDVKATIEVSSFRPYLGIGFGRAVPRGRLGCQFDLGVQFWGTPKVYAPTYENGKYLRQQLTDDHAGGDGGDVIKVISKIPVYPTINFRLVGRIL